MLRLAYVPCRGAREDGDVDNVGDVEIRGPVGGSLVRDCDLFEESERPVAYRERRREGAD